MRSIRGILPWAVVLAVLGGAVWWLLSNDMAAGPWLLAAVLVGHGAVHVLFVVPSSAASERGSEWPFGMATSWAVKGGLDMTVVRALGLVLIAVVVVGFALAALSTVGLIVPADWWQGAVAVSAVASAAVLVLFFNPQLVLGLGIDAVLLWAAVTRAWAPA